MERCSCAGFSRGLAVKPAAVAVSGGRLLPEGATVWITGLPAAGKTTLATALQHALREAGRGACLLDGDVIRQGLSQDLGLSRNDREEQARRVMHVAALIARSSLVALVALVSPYRDDRVRARTIHEDLGLPFVEVWLDTPLAVCERRDPKGLYAQARSRAITGMTGIDSPYESPESPELRIDGAESSPQDAARRVLTALTRTTTPTSGAVA